MRASVCICVILFAYVWICLHTCESVCICLNLFAFEWFCLHACESAYVWLCLCKSVSIYVYMCVSFCCESVWMCVDLRPVFSPSFHSCLLWWLFTMCAAITRPRPLVHGAITARISSADASLFWLRWLSSSSGSFNSLLRCVCCLAKSSAA